MSTPSQGRRTRASWIPASALVAPVFLLVAACSSEQMTNPTSKTDPSLCPGGPDTTAAFFANLPSWEDFASPDTVLTNELQVDADTLPVEEIIVDSVPVFDDQGLDSMMTNVRYVCQARPFTISDAPEKITMFSPNQSLLYAGAMIQGRSKKGRPRQLQPVLTNRVRIWVGLGTVDQHGARFDFSPDDQLHPQQTTWGQLRVHVTDVNGDNKSDLVLHWNASPHLVYVALAK